MSPGEKQILLTLQLNSAGDFAAEELDRQRRQLLAEVKELDVESVELVKSGELPEGAKAGELVTLGSLNVIQAVKACWIVWCKN